MPNLDQLLKDLSEESLAKRLIKHDIARERFSLKIFQIDSYKEFCAVISKYICYHKDEVGSKVGCIEEAFAIATNILDQAFSSEGGVKMAYYIGKTGVDGGLKRTVDTLAEGLRAQSEDDFSQFILKTYINPADWSERVDISGQYLERFRRFLPPGSTPMSAEELAPSIDKQILLHVKTVAKFAGRFRGV